MKRADKAIRIQTILEERIGEPAVPLDHKDPYTLLVAVLLSAQCTDERVNMVTPALFALADNPQDMSKVSVDKILYCIKSCGLAPRKSAAILSLSQIMMREYDGVVPANMEQLEALPGVGHKTASVVMSQAFGVPAFAVDTHIHRLAGRWGLSNDRNVVQTERDLKKIFPRESWIKLHLQIIYFGRQYCPARGHDLSQCPICSWAATKARISKERVGSK
ncbi:MAG: endonuclease-3 [Planctomycetota bacterium]|jgi:endonuclease-3